MSHSIRLRGPWEFLWGSTAGKVEFPCAWRELAGAVSVQPSDGRVVFRRRFGRPTGLDAGCRVLLSLRICGELLFAKLGAVPLSLLDQSDGSLIADVTAQLSERNELILGLVPPCPAQFGFATPIVEASLEIHLA